MKLPIGWLNDYVSTEGITPEELADKLLNIGFEVEEIIHTGEGIDRIVTGKILDIQKHPDADKLSVCKVDVGSESLTIVTGAKNISVGNTVPVALDGATLPNGVRITASPLRGVMSYGMLCSGAELGVDDNVIEGAEVNGILLLPNITPGTDIKDALRLNETVLDISVTANRPDCQCVYGMAREIAAMLGKKLKPLNLKHASVEYAQTPTVEVKDDACSRYTCNVISDVKIKKSPEWLRDRLRYVGIRPINNVVDITNYVLAEVGQPLHAFDTSFVSKLGIIVRKAENGEQITALDERTYTLNNNMLVIADNEKALAIAGVMGGEYSGITDATKNVLLESARFAKGNIRSTSRALGLRSDSSARYEKGVDYESVDIGRERALALFSMLKAGKVTCAFAAENRVKPQTKKIKTSAKKISELLGIEVKPNVVAKILKALTFKVETDGDNLTVEAPLFREDIENYTDLAEEVIRFYGYDNIKSTFMPSAKTTAGGLDTRQRNIDFLKSLACGFGAYEISTYSFIAKKTADKLNLPQDSVLRKQIELLNPLSDEYAVMRTQLASSMLNVVAHNFSKKNKDFRLFEVGKTYIAQELPLKELPQEHDTLCMAFTGEQESFYTMKYAVKEILRRFAVAPEKVEYGKKSYYHPGISCEYYLNGANFCSFGKLHPLVAKNYGISNDVYICEMNLNGFISREIPNVKFAPLPKYQTVERDLAVIVREEVPAGDIIKTAKNADPLCVHAELFDVYRGEQIEAGHKSVALSFTLSSPEKTLAEEEITTAFNNVLYSLEREFGAKLR